MKIKWALHFLWILILTGACLFTQHLPNIFELFVSENVEFKAVSKSSWVADTSDLASGIYFISVGRPRGPCSISINGEVVTSNSSPLTQVSSTLLLGAGFTNKAGVPLYVNISCGEIDGFGARLFHKPVVAQYYSGKCLHILRAAADTVLGPIFCLALIAVVIASSLARASGLKKNTNRRSVFREIGRDWRVLGFGLVAFAYSCSLAYYTRLFMPGFPASLLHIACKHLFTVAGILALSSFVGPSPWAMRVAIFNFSSWLAILAINPKLSLYFYDNYQMVFFPINLAITYIELRRIQARTRQTELLKKLAGAWCLTLIFDVVKNQGVTLTYTGPSIIAVIAAILTYARIKDEQRARRIAEVTGLISVSINSNISLAEALSQLATITSGNTHFSRVSAYLDNFCLGGCVRPHEEYIRVIESGYEKITLKDFKLNMSDSGRGLFMREAMNTQEIKLRTGKDGSWFIVVPIGRYAVINLSDDKVSSAYDAFESEEILKRLHPNLNTLNSRLLAQGFRQGMALERMRYIKGDGNFQCEIGALFADICDYSGLTDRYGQSYGEFISSVFWPALVKKVAPFAVPEFMRGDEVYFVSAKELIANEVSVPHAMFECIRIITDFLENEGSDICESHGYKPVRMAIGACAGQATVICDPLQVRTAGATVNQAKRLQEAAGSGGILIKCETLPSKLETVLLSDEIPVLVKKNFILGRRIDLVKLKDLPKIA